MQANSKLVKWARRLVEDNLHNDIFDMILTDIQQRWAVTGQFEEEYRETLYQMHGATQTLKGELEELARGKDE